jgi:hypothetical protein
VRPRCGSLKRLFDLDLTHLRRGDLTAAIRVLERGLDLSRTWQFVADTPFVAATLAAAYPLAGRADEALPWWQVLKSSATARDTTGLGSFSCVLDRSISRPDGLMRLPATLERHWRLHSGLEPEEARPTPSGSTVRLPRHAALRTLKATTARRWRLPSPAACVRLSPIAT